MMKAIAFQWLVASFPINKGMNVLVHEFGAAGSEAPCRGSVLDFHARRLRQAEGARGDDGDALAQPVGADLDQPVFLYARLYGLARGLVALDDRDHAVLVLVRH